MSTNNENSTIVNGKTSKFSLAYSNLKASFAAQQAASARKAESSSKLNGANGETPHSNGADASEPAAAEPSPLPDNDNAEACANELDLLATYHRAAAGIDGKFCLTCITPASHKGAADDASSTISGAAIRL